MAVFIVPVDPQARVLREIFLARSFVSLHPFVPCVRLNFVVVEAFNHTISFTAQAKYREIARTIKHVVIVGSPFVAKYAVELIWGGRSARRIVYLLIVNKQTCDGFESICALRLEVFNNYDSALVIIFEFEWQARPCIFVFFSAAFAQD